MGERTVLRIPAVLKEISPQSPEKWKNVEYKANVPVIRGYSLFDNHQSLFGGFWGTILVIVDLLLNTPIPIHDGVIWLGNKTGILSFMLDRLLTEPWAVGLEIPWAVHTHELLTNQPFLHSATINLLQAREFTNAEIAAMKELITGPYGGVHRIGGVDRFTALIDANLKSSAEYKALREAYADRILHDDPSYDMLTHRATSIRERPILSSPVLTNTNNTMNERLHIPADLASITQEGKILFARGSRDVPFQLGDISSGKPHETTLTITVENGISVQQFGIKGTVIIRLRRNDTHSSVGIMKLEFNSTPGGIRVTGNTFEVTEQNLGIGTAMMDYSEVLAQQMVQALYNRGVIDIDTTVFRILEDKKSTNGFTSHYARNRGYYEIAAPTYPTFEKQLHIQKEQPTQSNSSPRENNTEVWQEIMAAETNKIYNESSQSFIIIR